MWTLAAVISVEAISLAHLIGAARQEAPAGGKIPPFRTMMCIGLAALTVCAIGIPRGVVAGVLNLSMNSNSKRPALCRCHATPCRTECCARPTG
jgi:hypothetical protein